MARSHARVKTSIWHDDEFRDMSMPAQHLYFALLTDPGLSYAGIADWRPKRLAGRAGAWTSQAVEVAGCELLDSRFVIICEDTEEALVRSFLRHDGALQNAKLSVSAANAIGAIASNELRGIVINELQRLKRDFPEWAAWRADSIKTALRRKAINAKEIDPFSPDFSPALGRIWAKPGDAFGLSQSQGLE